MIASAMPVLAHSVLLAPTQLLAQHFLRKYEKKYIRYAIASSIPFYSDGYGQIGSDNIESR